MDRTEQLDVQIDWNSLDGATGEQKVPVSLFVLCKTIVEDEGGALFLNATVVQRVQVENVPLPSPQDPAQQESVDQYLKALMFGIDLKSPFRGGEVKARRDAAVTGLGVPKGSTRRCAQTFDLFSVPIDVCSEWHRFPFRILRGTVELELQPKTRSFRAGEEVFLCPTLCVSDPEKYPNNLVKTRPMDYFDRSHTLALLQEKPTVEIVEDARRKVDVQEVKTEDDLFITFPLMRLTFWLHEPTSKAVFKVLGPLLLVVTLMWVNFIEFHGTYIWDGCPGKDRDSDYLANGIGIAITAVFMIPLIRADSRKSHRGSLTSDDYIALAFLVGLGISTMWNCIVAFVGCVISSVVVFGAMGSLIAHYFECKKTLNEARNILRVRVDHREPKDKVKTAAQDFAVMEWIDAPEYAKARQRAPMAVRAPASG